MNTIGKIIKTARLNMGLTQEELANKVGVQKSAIAKWENGRVSEIKRSNLKALADTLGLDPNVLLGEDDECFTGSSKTLTLVPPAKSASAPQHAPDLPPDEQRLLDIYRDLSDDGKAVLLNYADDMSHLGKYKKRSPNKRDKLPEGSGSDQLRENMKYDYSPLPSTVVAESASSKYKKGK